MHWSRLGQHGQPMVVFTSYLVVFHINPITRMKVQDMYGRKTKRTDIQSEKSKKNEMTICTFWGDQCNDDHFNITSAQCEKFSHPMVCFLIGIDVGKSKIEQWQYWYWCSIGQGSWKLRILGVLVCNCVKLQTQWIHSSDRNYKSNNTTRDVTDGLQVSTNIIGQVHVNWQDLDQTVS